MKLLVTALLTLVSSLEARWGGHYHPRGSRYGGGRNANQFGRSYGHQNGEIRANNNRKMVGYGMHKFGQANGLGANLMRNNHNRGYRGRNQFDLQRAQTNKERGYYDKGQHRLQGLKSHNLGRYGQKGNKFLNKVNNRRDALKQSTGARRYRKLRRNRLGAQKKNYANMFNKGASNQNQYNKQSSINFNRNSSQNNVTLKADTNEYSNNNAKDYNSGNVHDNNSNYVNDNDEQQKMGQHDNYMNQARLSDLSNKAGMFRNNYGLHNKSKKALLRNRAVNRGAQHRNFNAYKNRHGLNDNKGYVRSNKFAGAKALRNRRYGLANQGKYGSNGNNFIAGRNKRYGNAHGYSNHQRGYGGSYW